MGIAIAIAIAALVIHTVPARADGDPASDVLVSQSLFLSYDAGLPEQQQTQLEALLGQATHSGYQLRVALIASPADLGSVSALWRQPQRYAEFLGEELSLVYRGTLLVVMPNGFGLYRESGPLGSAPSAIGAIQRPGSRLGPATLEAIERLAAASGHPLTAPSGGHPSGPSSGAENTVPWLVFSLGLVLIVLAWGMSVRVQPVRPWSIRMRLPPGMRPR